MPAAFSAATCEALDHRALLEHEFALADGVNGRSAQCVLGRYGTEFHTICSGVFRSLAVI